MTIEKDIFNVYVGVLPAADDLDKEAERAMTGVGEKLEVPWGLFVVTVTNNKLNDNNNNSCQQINLRDSYTNVNVHVCIYICIYISSGVYFC